MKRTKREKSLSREYYPVVVWLEDLEELCDAFKEEGGEVEISTDDCQFDSIKEAADYFGQRPQYDFKLSSSKPYAAVEFGLRTRVYVAAGPDSARLYRDLDEILTRSQRWPSFLYSYRIVVPMILSTWIIVPIIEGSHKWVSAAGLAWPQILLMPLYVWAIWVWFIRSYRSSVIKFRRRSDVPTFVERNRDELISKIVVSVISAIIGGAVGWWLK